MTEQPNPRVLVIGAGSIGTRHLRVIHGLGYPVLACDTDARAFDSIRRDMPDLSVFTRLDAALAEKPDMVVVATPHALHGDQTVAALEAGAHVFCEKPMADTLESAGRMIAAARRCGKVLHIGFVNRYHPCILRVKEMVESGRLGAPLFAQADLGSYRTLVCSRSRHQAQMFGALLLDYTHQLDYVPWILGSAAARIYAVGRRAGAFELKSDPNMISLTVEHANGIVSEIHLDYCRGPQVSTLSVTGDQGFLACDLMTGRLTLGKRADETFEVSDIAVERDDLFRDQFRNFAAAAEGKPARVISGEEGINSLRLVHGALASLQTRMPVEII